MKISKLTGSKFRNFEILVSLECLHKNDGMPELVALPKNLGILQT